MVAKKKLRVGLIGAGGISHTHCQGWAKLRPAGIAELVAVADLRREAAEKRAEEFEIADVEETAEALDLSLATVKRDWEFTKAWLLREMRGNRSNAS